MSNEAAARLRRLLGQERREELHDLALNGLLDDALAFERKAVVERIRTEWRSSKQTESSLLAILDAEAAR